MTITIKKWVYLITLSIIWGSSYILIKKGLVGLTPLQLGSTRIIMTTVILMIFGWKQLQKIPKNAWKWIILTGFFGTFFPSYLFAYAETVIDSSVAAVLNGMTPLFTLILGLLFFNSSFKWMKIVGVLVGFGGTLVLVSNEFTMRSGLSSWYAFLVVAATLCYSINVNLIKHKLQGVPALAIALGNFIAIVIPAFVVLLFVDFPWTKIISSSEVSSSIGYILILSLFGTALAKVMFNELVSISTAVFSISITYLLPIVAIAWGILDGEQFTLIQWLGCALILLGVYLITDKKRPKNKAS
ncbi:MAG: putative inner membrane transporter YedA [uncultured Bacteroidota bacterium]|nr:MAG: putative inner membrane transporter YedA [uncultured Bacteroidetes bacterium]|tara:strand:- start:117 stop:1013 length:897 start_codon:yes stop_codon:yes gene_type:complete